MFGKDKKEEFHEKILYEAQPNIFVYSEGILISMFVLGFLFFLYSAGISYIGNMNVYLIETTKVPLTRYFAIAIFIMIMIVFAYIIIKLLIWTSIKYTITESRVIVEKGILLQKKNYMFFNTIQDVSRSQSLWGKIFSVGTITLYSAYDGKDLELKDVSSPKKIENIIFESMRGTHLRRSILNDDDPYAFNPIRPNSDEQVHYRRMEDLDDLELVDAKERKRQLREIKRKAKNSRNNPNYNSNYNPNYDYGHNDDYYDYYDDYAYDDYSRPRDYNPDYRDNRGAYYDDRAPRDFQNQYDSRMGRPDSHHHQYSGAIKESYNRNPDKYFAENYEEFHQSNLEAQREYDDYIHGRAPYPNQNPEPPKVEKKKGLSRFNPFSSNNKEKDISDAEFDSTINQAMHDMGDNIKFQPSNDNQFRDSQDRYNQGYGQSRGYDRNYDNRYYDNYNDNYRDSRHSMDSYQDSRHLRDSPNAYSQDSHYNSYRQNENYGTGRNSYNSNSQRYDSNSSRNYYNDSKSSRNYHNDSNPSRNYYTDDGEVDYKYKSPRESRKRRGSNSHYENNGQYNESGHDRDMNDGNKNSDDIFEKHSRKFKR